MIILYIFVGFVGFLFGYFIHYLNLKNKNNPFSKYSRRGILKRSYSITDSITGKKTGDVEVLFEIGETERTDKKSKIKVIEFKTSNSEWSKDSKIPNMVDNSWIDSSEIEWIELSNMDKRNDKIDNILK